MPRQHQKRKPTTTLIKRVIQVVLLLCFAHCMNAQFVEDDPKFEDQIRKAKQELSELLKEHPDLERIYRPERFQPITDVYTIKGSDEDARVNQNVIFDPCRDIEFNCCNETYGTPEFEKVNQDRGSLSLGSLFYVNEFGQRLHRDNVRTPDPVLYLAPECTGMLEPFEWCYSDGMGRRSFPLFPKCWNFNESIQAQKSCRSPRDGTLLPFCIELAITQTAYIPECGGEFKDSNECGNFLEVHRPGSIEVLTSVRIKGQYTSGYSGIVISSNYKRDPKRILCKGDYEMWWVHKTRSEFIIVKQISFRVIEPECDWDARYNKFNEWRTVTDDGSLEEIGLTLFEKSKRLFNRERIVGRRGRPGPGMGSTLVHPDNTTYPSNAIFDDREFFTFSFFDQLLPSDIKDGELYPTHPNFGDRNPGFQTSPSPPPPEGGTKFELGDKAKATVPPAFRSLSTGLRRRLQPTYIPRTRAPPAQKYETNGSFLLDRIRVFTREHMSVKRMDSLESMPKGDLPRTLLESVHKYGQRERSLLLGEVPHQSKATIALLHRGTITTGHGKKFLAALNYSKDNSQSFMQGKVEVGTEGYQGMTNFDISTQKNMAEELKLIAERKARLLELIRRQQAST